MQNEDSLVQFTLENGLRVILKPIHTAPIVSNWVWYDVGSRNEQPGKTGVSHWVEHMQFKGTTQHSASEMDHAIARVGGMWNAFTSSDFTTYFETLPANSLELALELEADRMRNSLFDPAEVETERTVILSEREGSENEPRWLLSEAVNQVSFTHHPYRNEVIGSRADLQALTRDDLFGHYQRYYQPHKALLCIAGDFEVNRARDLVQRYFGDLSGAPSQLLTPDPEPTLPEFQKVELSGPGETTYLQIAYRAPKANDDDFFAFTILDSLLAGPSSLNMFGSGSISNRTSRLYLNLIETEYAVSLSGGLNASVDPTTYDLYLTLHPAHSPKELLAKLDDQLQLVAEQARALFAYGSDNITNQAFWMGYSHVFADYSWFTGYIDQLARVRLDDVARVARHYLDPDRRVIGIYHPEEA
jgi:zinc protease